MESLREILTRVVGRSISASGADRLGDPGPRDGEGTLPLPEEVGEGVCPQCRGFRYLRHDVPYGHPDFGRVVPCECARQAASAEQVALLWERSNLGPLRRLTFENLIPQGRSQDPQVQERFQMACTLAREFATEPQGWLVLAGASGCGKTHLAAAIANACLDQGQPVYFVVVPDLLDHLRATFAPGSEVAYDQLFETIRTFPLLILDDLGTQSSTPWAQEKLFQLINHRYNTQLPTVFTTNRLPHLEERLQTRLCDPTLARVCLIEEHPSGIQPRDALGLELLRGMTLESFDRRPLGLSPEERQSLESAYNFARSFAENPEGWLVLMGPCGCGKTHLAAAIANQRRQRGLPVVFWVVPDLLDHLRSTFMPESRVTYDEVFERVKSTPLLILDDLGAHASSPWAQEKLYQIINHRYNGRLPTVITSNLNPKEIEGRLLSRMMDEQLSKIHILEAPDYRGNTPVERGRLGDRGRGASLGARRHRYPER